MDVITKLNRKFNEEELEQWAEFEAALLRQQECTCRPQDALLCPSCLEYTREKYGDDIPYGGDDWFRLQEMKDNTHTEGRE